MIETLNQATNGQAPVVIAVITALLTFALGFLVRRAQPALARSAVGARIAVYIAIVAQSWLLTGAVLVILWCLALREGTGDLWPGLDEMGLNIKLPANDVMLWTIAMVIVVVAITYVAGYTRRFFGGRATQAALDIIPETSAETAVFSLLVSPTAGFGEEFVYRGFALGQIWGLTWNGWLAAVLSSVIFGLAHSYQGWWGIVRAGLIGFVFATGVVVTGSLVPSILAHTLANMLSAVTRKPVLRQPAMMTAS